MLAAPFMRVKTPEAVGGMPAVKEAHRSYLEDARAKAYALLPALPTGAWALADDSGLEVAALQGAPGPQTRIFAGPDASDEEARHHLLQKIMTVPYHQRVARYVCCMVLCGGPQSQELVFWGYCPGMIHTHELGSKDCFSFDSLFIPYGHRNTFAELPLALKNLVSHRGEAIKGFWDWFHAMAGQGMTDAGAVANGHWTEAACTNMPA